MPLTSYVGPICRSAVALLVLCFTGVVFAQTGVSRPTEATFTITMRGVRIGAATSSVTKTPTGWAILGTTKMTTPNVEIRRIDLGYSSTWVPDHVTLDLATPEEEVVVHGGGFGASTPARVDIVRGGRQVTFVTAAVSPDALILPNFAYSAYEALAMRLEGAAVGTTFRAYVLAQRELTIRIESVADESLRAKGASALKVHRWHLTFVDPSGDVPADIWVESGRMLRFDLPSQGLSIARADLSL